MAEEGTVPHQNWVVGGSVILRDTFPAGWLLLVKLSTSFITPVSYCVVPEQLLKHLQEILPLEWLAEVTYEGEKNQLLDIQPCPSES